MRRAFAILRGCWRRCLPLVVRARRVRFAHAVGAGSRRGALPLARTAWRVRRADAVRRRGPGVLLVLLRRALRVVDARVATGGALILAAGACRARGIARAAREGARGAARAQRRRAIAVLVLPCGAGAAGGDSNRPLRGQPPALAGAGRLGALRGLLARYCTPLGAGSRSCSCGSTSASSGLRTAGRRQARIRAGWRSCTRMEYCQTGIDRVIGCRRRMGR